MRNACPVKVGHNPKISQFHEVGYLQGVPERAAASTLGSRWRTSTHCPSPSVKVAWELTLSAAGGIGWTVGTQPMVHPAATDCSPCRGNRSRSPRRPSVANATGAHTGLASIAGPVLILISGAHRVDTAMVAANLRVRRLRRAAADFVREHRGYDIGCVAAASPASGPDVHRSGIRAVRRDLGCGGPPGCRVQPELRVFGTLTGAVELEVTDG